MNCGDRSPATKPNGLSGHLTKEFIYMLGVGLSIGIEKKKMKQAGVFW
jgi:hypothetical protein